MHNIVIVEDNSDLRASLIDILLSESANVFGFDSSEAFLTGCSLQTVDVVLLDLNLPGEDGIALAKRLKLLAPHIGIVMLSARSSADEVGLGYNSGADIYLVKPSSTPELKGAVDALLRRTVSSKGNEEKILLDLRSMTISGPDGDVTVSNAEGALLKEFILAPENRLAKNEIAQILCISDDAKSGTLEVRIVRLRKKLALVGANGKIINAVRGWGYQLAATIVLA